MDPGTIIAVVQIASKVLSLITKYYSGVKNAKSDIEGLKTEVEGFRTVLGKIHELVQSSNNASKLPVSASLAAAVQGSLSDIENIKNKLDPGKGKRAMSRITGLRALQWPFTKEEVAEHIARLERHKTTLSLALSSDQISLMLGIDENVFQLQQDQDTAKQDQQLRKLFIADGAAFDSFYRQHEPQCVENTRVDLLRQVQSWSTSADGKCIFWLNGMAGTGKSTIARTVAHAFADQNRLGASFFFSRGTGDLGNATKFVSTLAHQLATLSPLFKQPISRAIADHSNVVRQGLRNQWKELILMPLSNLNGPRLTLTFVIDALDECERQEDIKLILQLFVEIKVLVTVKLKVFLTSRPETPIRLGFKHMPEILHQDLILHDIPRSIVEHDIRVFLGHELDRIKKDRNLLGDWPNPSNINLLVKKSDGLFIYIATACRFIEDPKWRPEERLSLILKSNGTRHQLTAKLDGMYMQILKLSIFQISDEEDLSQLSERFRRIIGSIVTLYDVLSTVALAGLLNASIEDVSLTLDSLHSVLNVPGLQTLPIRLLHPSFRDFLVDSRRCDNNYFYINQELAHMELARSCLQLLSLTLKRDICNLQRVGTLINEVQRSEIDDHLSKDVQYASRYWVDHLERVDHERRIKIGLHDDGKIHVFLLKHMLHWLETLSLMGKISEGVRMITRLESMLEPLENSALKALVYDAKRFILSNRSIVEEAPLQLYYSALAFCPQQSIIKANYRSELPTWITKYPVVEDNWSSLLQVLEGHTDSITAVAFSDDGQLLASASSDQQIRLWDPATGTLWSTLEGHTSRVTAVAFSGNGLLIASASEDRTILVWDSATGTLRSTLQGYTNTIFAVAFSGDSLLMASASIHGTLSVRLWDPVTETLLSTLQGHTNGVTEVAFSGNGLLMASASNDGTVRLWDLAMGTLRSTLEGHTGSVTAVAFSGDGHFLASASYDGTVLLWDLVTETLSTLKGHTTWVSAVAFSGNGQLLASASQDRTIRLWDPATGKLRSTLEGHENLVTAVAFSGDGQLLASGSFDDTIRLWDPTMKTLQSTLQGHASPVTVVAFSGDGQLLVSASSDGTIQLWDTATGALQKTLEGHTNSVTEVAFSGNGLLMASASNDGTVRLWDLAMGTLRSTLESHTGSVTAVAFSGDGHFLASASYFGTVLLWDLVTETLSTLKGHKDSVTAVAFSGNNQLLASASQDSTIKLWDPATGNLVQQIEAEGIQALSFSPDQTQLVTNLGAIRLSNNTDSWGPSWRLQQNWITWNNRKALWLPPGFRPRRSAIRGNLIVMGYLSGRVTFLELQPSFDVDL